MASLRRRSLGNALLYARQWFYRLTVGGYWALALPGETQHNLRWFWFDGLFASASDNIYTTYLAIYVLALGGTRGQVGLLSSLSSLSAALVLLPAAMLVERIGRRKAITMVTGGTVARLMILVGAVAPWLWEEPDVVWIIIALGVLRDTFANFGYPAWAAMAGDIIPPEGRGRYLGSRFWVMNVAGAGTMLLAGWLITRVGGVAGYQFMMLAAFALGVVSTSCFAQIRDPKGTQDSQPTSEVLPRTPTTQVIPKMVQVLRSGIRQRPAFAWLLATTALWNFSLNVAGPFFSVYLVRELDATAALVGITTATTSVSMLLVQQRWGLLADRWGPRRIQVITMLTIPILPILWMLAWAAWNIIFVNVISGILWSGFTLASFSLLLALTPDQERARYSAIFQVVVLASLALGAAVGSLIVTQWGYPAVFLASGVGRFIAGIIFARRVRIGDQDRAAGIRDI